MELSHIIPPHTRVVVRTVLPEKDPYTQRSLYSDYIGHVVNWDGKILQLNRDASGNGRRPAEEISIPADIIVRIKPIPERKFPPRRISSVIDDN